MNLESIKYVMGQMGITDFKESGEWVTTHCPLAEWNHGGGTDNNPSFGVRETTGVSGVHCFSCGYKGGMLNLVQTYGKHATKEGRWSEDHLSQMIDYVLLAEDEDEVNKPVMKKTEVQVPDELSDYLQVNDPYFTDRGIKAETQERWHLGFVERYYDEATSTALTHRALFPVYERKDGALNLKGIVGRTTNGQDPKYKNAPPSFRKAKYLYGGWLAEDKRKIIVVEGPVDCIKVNQVLEDFEADDMFAVGLMGADPSKEQVDWLKANADEVICLLDNDPSGRMGTKKLIDALEPHLIVSVVNWTYDAKDPDELGTNVIGLIQDRRTILEHRLAKLFGA